MTVKPADVRQELAFSDDALPDAIDDVDTFLQGLIDRETLRVEDEIDVSLGVETVTEQTSRPASVDGVFLPLDNRPVQSVVDVTIDTDRVSGPAVTADDYIVEETHIELEPEADRNRWPTKRRSITVEYEHGYPDGDVPAPIDGAIIGLVRHAITEIEADGVESESIAGQSVNYELGEDVVARHLYRAKQFDEPSFYGGTQVI